jgi:hypothetical protein
VPTCVWTSKVNYESIRTSNILVQYVVAFDPSVVDNCKSIPGLLSAGHRRVICSLIPSTILQTLAVFTGTPPALGFFILIAFLDCSTYCMCQCFLHTKTMRFKQKQRFAYASCVAIKAFFPPVRRLLLPMYLILLLTILLKQKTASN